MQTRLVRRRHVRRGAQGVLRQRHRALPPAQSTDVHARGGRRDAAEASLPRAAGQQDSRRRRARHPPEPGAPRPLGKPAPEPAGRARELHAAVDEVPIVRRMRMRDGRRLSRRARRVAAAAQEAGRGGRDGARTRRCDGGVRRGRGRGRGGGGGEPGRTSEVVGRRSSARRSFGGENDGRFLLLREERTDGRVVVVVRVRRRRSISRDTSHAPHARGPYARNRSDGSRGEDAGDGRGWGDGRSRG
mmetsp:Transcript_11541/g.49742  ORF Transcript_11541/g.49742 Transcript_11541/m.49742 type:complete len:245 (-) Transcript_11541:772-1506(-)